MAQVGVIGVGSFGEKRAAAVKVCKNGSLVAVADINTDQASKVADKLEVKCMEISEMMASPEIDTVIVCVPNKYHYSVVTRALHLHNHVMCEKPLAPTSVQALAMTSTAQKCGRLLKVGSNHRYFSSVLKARELVDSGYIGEVIGFDGRIGHNGERIKNSWFWDEETSGGGTLLDNGHHMLDLARWFMGDFVTVTGLTSNSYWKECKVEDSAAAVLATGEGKMAVVASSWRQMAGYFQFELNGTEGYISVEGRFDSHGGDCLYCRSKKTGGVITKYDFGHLSPNSQVLELEDFFNCIENGTKPSPTGEDGAEILKLIETIYRG